ncbi:tyrosine-type recombinase/integrase [Actinomadura violacea]|uniref:Tyrosine-type recombinase/integrase n=1 Tax=Actinomadura violacea TaxID=2819934 RepID=A0ABS3RY93_9ACTN|nr:tyrosine-type recombinase/integrase [Actinomadura violacea]MBO2461731.1 tyrosine-type recombinase/integrase [Actinomadura violacea]
MGDVALLPTAVPLARAIPAFLTGYERIGSEGTRRVYRGTLNAVATRFGEETPVGAFGAPGMGEAFRVWFRERYGPLSPATYCRHLATCQSAFGWWQLQGWLASDPTVGLSRPSIPRGAPRARPDDEVRELLTGPGVPLRERTLWTLLYETAARAEEILSLDVPDLDLPNKRVLLRGKGGHQRWVFWQTGAARLLPRLLAGRQAGPVFLSHRPPRSAVASVDLCPVTGRARLSYRRAAELFKDVTGLRLHDLRHSQLTHEAETGTNPPMLLARSGHASLRSLEPYIAGLSAAAVARHVAERDPARRRR